MVHFITWIIVSGIAGFIASKIINKTGEGMLLDILLGIAGGFVGGAIIHRIPAFSGLGGEGGMKGLVAEIIVAAIGAAVIILIYNLIFRRAKA